MLPNALKQECGPTSVLNAPQKGISLVQQQNQQQSKAACQKANLPSKPKEKQPGYIEQLWRALIRPPNRIDYKPSQLGPTSFVLDKTVIVKREDFKVKNSRGYNLECSYFEPISISGKPHPCVLYLHGNSSSRNEGVVLIQYLLPYGISLVLMDFSGCGISEGEFISLGYYEKFDAKQVIDHVKKWKPITEFGLWGRSMGAATTLMTSLNEDSSIRFIVVDSSFVSIKQLCQEIAVETYKVPKFILNWAYQYIRKKIKNLAKFDLDECNALKAVQNQKNKPSALFLVAKTDTLISPSHSQSLYNLYRGSKRLLMFEGTHNSRRPREINQEITKFFYNGFFDEYAKKQFNVFKMVPQLPSFQKTEPQQNPNQNNIQKNAASIAGPIAAPNSIVSIQNNPSVGQIKLMNGANPQKEDNSSKQDISNQNTQAAISSFQNRIKYISTGQLQSKNVEKEEEVQEEDEGDMNSIQKSEQIKINPTHNSLNNHISQKANPPQFLHKENQRFSPKSVIPEPSIQNDGPQFDFINQNNLKFKADSLSKMNNPSEFQIENPNQNNFYKASSSASNINTINHHYNNNVYPLSMMIQNQTQQTSNSIIQINEDSNISAQERSADKTNKHQKNQMQFSNFRHIQQTKNQIEESKQEQDQEGVMSEESKVYSVNMQNAQVNLNTEGVEQSPKPKSQYNFDSNNILINFQRYNNNAVNSNNNIGSNNGLQIINNGSILQPHVNKNQDIKEEEDTQFNSKIDKFDQDNVNQNIGLSGFYIPQEYNSQIQNSGLQNNQLNSNRFPSPNPQNMQNIIQNERIHHNLFFHTNSIISGSTPNQLQENRNNVANSPDQNTSPQKYKKQKKDEAAKQINCLKNKSSQNLID